MDIAGLVGGVPEWPRSAGRVTADERGSVWFFECLLRGAVVLVPVSVAMMALFAMQGGDNLARDLFIVVFLSPFAYMFALLAAFTGALLYLPAVWWAARRWTRAGRAIALACTPLMLLGTLPYWGMWRMVEIWQIWMPAAAGLLVWAATLRLPAPAARAAGGAIEEARGR